jgi:hypothetical protein
VADATAAARQWDSRTLPGFFEAPVDRKVNGRFLLGGKFEAESGLVIPCARATRTSDDRTTKEKALHELCGAGLWIHTAAIGERVMLVPLEAPLERNCASSSDPKWVSRAGLRWYRGLPVALPYPIQ